MNSEKSPGEILDEFRQKLNFNRFMIIFYAALIIIASAIFTFAVFEGFISGSYGIWTIIWTVVLSLVALFSLYAIIAALTDLKKMKLPAELKQDKRKTFVVEAIVIVFCIVLSVLLPFLEYNVFFVGYRSGDYSEHTCEDCDDAANGGAWLDNDFGNKYYCEYHYNAHKTALDKYKENHFDHDDSDILQIAEDTVKQNLKAPSTATFSSIRETQIKRSGNTWTVSGWVDAQNSFGAMLRSEYTVKITFTSKYNYTIDICIID